MKSMVLKIPAKTRVIVNGWAIIGRDTKQWAQAEAEKFQPERFLDSTVDYIGNDFQVYVLGSWHIISSS